MVKYILMYQNIMEFAPYFLNFRFFQRNRNEVRIKQIRNRGDRGKTIHVNQIVL